MSNVNDNEKDLNCENCGAEGDSDNYIEGIGWVCDECMYDYESDQEC